MLYNNSNGRKITMFWPVAIFTLIGIAAFAFDAVLTTSIIENTTFIGHGALENFNASRVAGTKMIFLRIFRNALFSFVVVSLGTPNHAACLLVSRIFIALSAINIFGYTLDTIEAFRTLYVSLTRRFVLLKQTIWSIVMYASAIGGIVYMVHIRG